MTLTDATVAVMFLGGTLYALFGGADFGAGFWDLTAGGARRGAPSRALIAKAIGPVWEANHVWLIFALVVLWTGFPRAFAPVMATLYVPLTAAAVGVILRGAGFAFRKAVTTVEVQRAFGAVFALSSVLTPFFLGTVIGAVASGRVPREGAPADAVSAWLNPTSVLGGTLAVAVCAYLAATYLAAEAERRDEPGLARRFRARALATGVATGVVALAGIAVLAADAPRLFSGLTGRALPLMILSAAGALASFWLLWRGRYRGARYGAALAVGAVLWGWGAAQYPDMLVGQLTIDQAAGSRATLVAMLTSLGVGAVLFVPALVALLVVAQRGELSADAGPLG